MLKGDKGEAGIGCDHRNGALGEKWGSPGRQKVPGEAGVSRCRPIEFDPPIQKT